MPELPIPFGEWLPDLPPTGLQGLVTATNVIPDANFYRPFPTLTLFATGVAARARGTIVATDGTGNNYNFVGDQSALYTLVGTSLTSVTRITGPYNTATDDYWEFVNWGNTIIGVNGFSDLPQQISLGSTTFFDLSTGVKGKHLAVMKDFVVMGNVSDSATNVYRVRWCAINNPTSWTADASTLADYQDLPSEGGPVQKVLGGEFGVVLQQKGVWRMIFVGSPIIFQFDRIHANIGLYAPQGAVRYQNMTYFVAEDGFYSFDGSQVQPIGRGRVDRFFFDDLDTSQSNRIWAYIDTQNKLVLWAYPSTSNVGGNPDKIMVYSWAFDRWALVEGLNIELIMNTVTTGSTLEQMDTLYPSIDSIPVSLDSSQWQGGKFILGAFDYLHRMNRFNGSAMAATLETGEFQMFEGLRAMLTEVRPDVVGLSASASIAIINRNNLTESASVGAVAAFPNVDGFVPFLVDSRYFRVRLYTAVNTEFTHLIGVHATGVPSGVR